MDKKLKALQREVAGAGAESGPHETAAYISEMAGSLATLARRNGMTVLAYVLDMAREEAQTHANASEAARVRQ